MGAIFYVATDRDEKLGGSAWLLVYDGPVFTVPKEAFKQGVYKMIGDSTNVVRAAFRGIKARYLFNRDVWRIMGNAIITIGLGTALAKTSRVLLGPHLASMKGTEIRIYIY